MLLVVNCRAGQIYRNVFRREAIIMKQATSIGQFALEIQGGGGSVLVVRTPDTLSGSAPDPDTLVVAVKEEQWPSRR